MAWYRNHYECDACDDGAPPERWNDEWSCMCNDRCPRCNYEIEPYQSDDLTVIITPLWHCATSSQDLPKFTYRAPGADAVPNAWMTEVSPATAEDKPAYAIDVFDTEAEALAHIAKFTKEDAFA